MPGPLASMFGQIAQQQPMPQGTRLSPQEEVSYRRWKTTLPKNLQYEGDYDLRGFFKKNPNFRVDDPSQHMTDEFKMPNHKTFSDESRYYNPSTARFGGHWTGDVFEPNSRVHKQRVDESSPYPSQESGPLPRANPYINPMLDDSPAMSDRTTFDRTPAFRDPQQAGPEPPVDPRVLARLFGDR